MIIRRAALEDCGLLWVWANDSEVRGNSLNQQYIPWISHVGWFHSKLANPLCQLWILENDAGDPMAVVRFDAVSEDLATRMPVHAEISVTVARHWRGMGYGAEVIRMASEKSGLEHIQAVIKTDNIASQKAFSRAGYVKVSETYTKGQNTVLMVLDKPNKL